MTQKIDQLSEFRNLVNRRARQSPAQWDASRQLIDKKIISTSLDRLRHKTEKAELPAAIKDHLRLILRQNVRHIHDLDRGLLKSMTGLPPAKALRALCIYFDLVEHPSSRWPLPALSSRQVEHHVRRLANPFDLLQDSEVASLLDLGAGDLSFAAELAALYGPQLQQQHRNLILHCIDRLHPHSKLGGPLHPEKQRLHTLQEQLGAGFGFFGDQDMFDLHKLEDQGKLASRYAIVTCWAPATPTFAYEPSRLSPSVITADLRRIRGSFRRTRFEGEHALEVQHGQRTLFFPSWKFDIVGPLALLNLLAARGSLCVVGAVDSQVFWEILSQLLEDPAYRPPDTPFTPENLPRIFGDLYNALDRLPTGETVSLADLATLRTHGILTHGILEDPSGPETPRAFRYVQIRRGATFPGIPVSSTARKFTLMVEEAPPWFLTLVPAE